MASVTEIYKIGSPKAYNSNVRKAHILTSPPHAQVENGSDDIRREHRAGAWSLLLVLSCAMSGQDGGGSPRGLSTCPSVVGRHTGALWAGRLRRCWWPQGVVRLPVVVQTCCRCARERNLKGAAGICLASQGTLPSSRGSLEVDLKPRWNGLGASKRRPRALPWLTLPRLGAGSGRPRLRAPCIGSSTDSAALRPPH